MPQAATFDTTAAHRFFAAQCFNNAWTLIEKAVRTPDEDEQMLRLAQASMWHWTQREDCKDPNLSIGYWQLARVCALLKRADDARRYGELSLRYTSADEPFQLAYAHEALARAAKIAGDRAECGKHLERATKLAESIGEPDDRKLLLDDLATI